MFVVSGSLPVPVDDGAADHLLGGEVPSLSLPSTLGGRLELAEARELFGAVIAEIIPEEGLVDVHRYITITLEGQRVEIDATFPGPAWDGRSSLPLACGPGRDHPVGEDPDAEKQALEEQHCDPAIREPFIAALASI